GAAIKASGASISEDVGKMSAQVIGGVKIEKAKMNRSIDVKKQYYETVGGTMTLDSGGTYVDNAQKTSKWRVAAAMSLGDREKLVEAVGKAPLTGIVVDGSYFPAGIRIPGIADTEEAYDAPNSAFAVNFNTINAERRGKTVVSAEKQTPITPLAIAQFLARGPKGRGRISLAQENPAIGLRYAGELLAAFIGQAGGSVAGEVRTGTVPAGLEPVHVHRQSRPLFEILTQLLLGSNNYVANQIFLEIGAHRLGGPVSLEKSLKVAEERLEKVGLADAIHLEEGSGISPKNHFTARGLAALLGRFVPHADLLRKTRGGSFYKTGTIPAVRTLAGYANTSKHGLARFVIALGGNTGDMRFRLLTLIERGF
ncbi:MAG: D-alanyl-D-alanine carboxypeptidase, partial [Hyphomicrobiales bacterium]|nr:D-alanyl-D-alanine carboxypeptidase [Hyphomicrobiales bacterium]